MESQNIKDLIEESHQNESKDGDSIKVNTKIAKNVK